MPKYSIFGIPPWQFGDKKRPFKLFVEEADIDKYIATAEKGGWSYLETVGPQPELELPENSTTPRSGSSAKAP